MGITNIAVVDRPLTRSDRRRLVRVVAAATVGTALEWFDLLIYGFLAVTISKLFFPSSGEFTSLLLTLGTFSASYLMRPLGALVLGSYADRAGRKKALTLAIGLMALGTFLIAIAPTYVSIGIYAPILIVVARLIQGLSAGGEFGASTSFLVEHAPINQRGFYASFQMAAQGGTAVLASLFGALLSRYFSPEQLIAWAWRIPFVFGLLIIPVAYYIRAHVEETPIFTEKPHATSPVRETFSDNKIRLLLAIGVYVLLTASSFVIVVYMPTFAIKQLGIDPSIAFGGTLLLGTVQIVACPLAGALSDRAGRKRVLLVAGLILGLIVTPLFMWLVANPAPTIYFTTCAVLGLAFSGYQGPMPAVLSELFPSRVRTTGLALTHNIAVTIFGGFAPLIVTWGIRETQSLLVPPIYISSVAVISVVSLLICISRFGDKRPIE